MKAQICTVIIGETLKEFLKNLKAGQRLSDLVELRVDYIENLRIQDLELIRKNTFKKSIFTCRHQSEGGKFRGTEKERAVLIQKAVTLQFEYIDLEYSASKLIQPVPKNRLILSYHNFETTPTLRLLQTKVQAMLKFQPKVIKLATFIQQASDIRTLLTILLEAKKQQCVVIGMGEKGKWTRVLFPLLGSFCTFAALNKDQASAPGQMTFAEMKRLFIALS